MDGLLIALAAALALVGSAQAQPPAQPAPDAVEVSAADLEKFADVFVALQQHAKRYEADMLRVKTEDEARDVQARMQQESVAAVAKYGWTPEEYVAVAQAINADPALAEKTQRLIDLRQ